MTANFQTAADVYHGWRDDILTGRKPTLYPCGSNELARIEIGPGLVTVVGGAPGAGKTAFSMQLVIDGLRLNEGLRVLVANVEVSPGVLLDRQLARLSGIDAGKIRRRELEAAHAERLDAGMSVIESVADRMAFLRPPFDLGNTAAAADAFDAGVIVFDYLQRFKPPGESGDRRGGIDAMMNYLRQFADVGVAVIVVAAVARQKDSKGRTSYSGDAMNLASFRESSELEFGADDAFIIAPEETGELVTLKHLKARHTAPKDIALRFDRARQQFTPTNEPAPAKPVNPKRRPLRNALIDAWNNPPTADDDDRGDE